MKLLFRSGITVLRGGIDLLKSISSKSDIFPTIITYHGVVAKYTDRQVQNNQIEIHEFLKQIDYITKRFNVVSLPELQDTLTNNKSYQKNILAITLDDGYANNIDIVYPELRARGLASTLFIPTDLIGTSKRIPTYYVRALIWAGHKNKIKIPSISFEHQLDTFSNKKKVEIYLIKYLKALPYEKMKRFIGEIMGQISEEKWQEINQSFHSEALMDWNGVRYLYDEGVVIGSHGANHVSLHNRQSSSIINNELKNSKKRIEDKLGECKYFSFPSGSMIDMSIDAIKQVSNAGYELAFSTEKSIKMTINNRLTLPRICDVKSFPRLLVGMARYKILQKG